MRKFLLTVYLLLPLMASGQATLPACPSAGTRDNCRGVLLFPNGVRYEGEFQKGIRFGRGIEFNHRGEVSRDGFWNDWKFSKSPDVYLSHVWPAGSQKTPAKVENEPGTAELLERERRAELESERKKSQDLEQRLAVAEARERERVQAQAQPAPQPPRPQAAIRPERRVALIVGNATYKFSPLDNPVNDATDVDAGLKRSGFQTTLLRNATLAQMREATRRFADQLTTADVALIYFAGHGIESRGRNYMVPVNADLKFEHELLDQAFDANQWPRKCAAT